MSQAWLPILQKVYARWQAGVPTGILTASRGFKPSCYGSWRVTPTRNSRLCRGGCSLIAKRRPAGLPEQQNQDDDQRRYGREGVQQLG